MSTFATTYRELAEALGLAAASRAHELAKEPWWPPKGPEGWDVDECRLRLARKRAGKPPIPDAAPAPPSSAPAVSRASENPLVAAREREHAVPELADEDRRLVEVLRTSSDEVELVRATMVLMSRRLGASLAAQALPAKALTDFTVALEELRKTQDAVLELGKDRGEWIERDVARAIAGQMSRTFVEACERLVMRLPQQVETWLADPELRATAPEERARRIRAWATDQTRALRTVEAGGKVELDRRIQAEIAEQRG